MFFFTPANNVSGSTTLLPDQDAKTFSSRIESKLLNFKEQGGLKLPELPSGSLVNIQMWGENLVSGIDSAHLLSRLRLPHLQSICNVDDVCRVLHIWGEERLADRMAYLASDEDLEEGEVPATLESSRAFLAFWGAVESEGRVDLACSPDGQVSAVWRFASDQRRACIWFLDDHRVRLAATDAAGEFIKVAGEGGVSNPSAVMGKLVEAGLLTWFSNKTPSASSRPPTALPDTVANAVWETMDSPWKKHSGSEWMKFMSPPMGWSASTIPTGPFR